jgi:predicted RNase H-like HicB family nuclease
VSGARRYPKHVFWSDEDEGFIALAPDLPGASAFGETEAEAVAELDQAIDAWVEAARAAGNAVPTPSRPAAASLPSGKVLVRMPKGLHRRAALCAEREDVSLNQFIVACIAEAVGERSHVTESRRFWNHPIQQIHPLATGWVQQQTSPTIGSTVVAPIGTTVSHGGTFETMTHDIGRLGVGLEVYSGVSEVLVAASPTRFETFAMISAQTKQDYIFTLVETKAGKSHARG